jgi:alkylation response protein AidB-like acyl-CoA dehydrogenase
LIEPNAGSDPAATRARRKWRRPLITGVKSITSSPVADVFIGGRKTTRFADSSEKGWKADGADSRQGRAADA